LARTIPTLFRSAVDDVAEEVDDPIGMPLWLEVEDRARDAD
jgi:hypothetical protein